MIELCGGSRPKVSYLLTVTSLAVTLLAMTLLTTYYDTGGGQLCAALLGGARHQCARHQAALRGHAAAAGHTWLHGAGISK